jgi:hypothetical protein
MWVGTVVVAISAVVAVASYRRSLYDRKREQASRVAAWFGRPPDITLETAEATPRTYRADVPLRLHVANRSDGAVYSVSVMYSLPDDLTRATAPPATLTIREIPAGKVAQADVVIPFSVELAPGSELDDERAPWITLAPVTVAFTDALGQRWRRVGSRPVRRQRRWFDEPDTTRLRLPVRHR